MIAGLLLLVSAAFAQVEVCPGPYDNEALLADLDGIDAAFGEVDVEAARERIKHAHRMLLCLEEPVDVLGVARFSRQISMAFFFDQDEDALRRWSRMTHAVAPDFPWPADIARDHPFREFVDGMKPASTAGPDASLVVPGRGAIWWNGKVILTPELPIETPGLVQVEDPKEGWRIWWQDGSAFPEDLLGEPGQKLSLPKGYVEPTGDPRFAEHAARPLFGEAPALPEGPAPELEVDEAALEEARKEEVRGAYSDPFADARRRAIRRQYFETTQTNERGDTITRKTEVLTLAPEDPRAGQPVTGEAFEFWLQSHPEWLPETARQAGRADETYLSDWVDGHPPANAAREPVLRVHAAAAAAYCESYAEVLPRVGSSFDPMLAWEWRAGEGAVRESAKGKTRTERQPLIAREDTGFRCVEPDAR